MEQQAKDKLFQKLSIWIDGMTPYDRFEIFMDQDRKIKYESRIVDKGILDKM